MAATLLCGAAFAESPAAKLYDGFDGPDFSPAGGLYYRDNFEQSAGTVEFQKAIKLNGDGALKLSVKPLCAADDDGCSERAEIWEKTELRVPYDQGVWYGFAVKFADPDSGRRPSLPDRPVETRDRSWRRRRFQPFPGAADAQRQAVCDRRDQLRRARREQVQSGDSGCKDGGAPVWFRPETNQMRALVATDAAWQRDDNDLYHGCTKAIAVTDHGNKLPLPSSGWIDFAIYTKPGPDGTGHIEIFANGKPIVTVKGHIGHADKGLGREPVFQVRSVSGRSYK